MIQKVMSLLVFAFVLQGQIKKPEPLTVCEVLSGLAAYQGQRITMRGELIGGDEVVALIGDGCAPLVTDGYRWPMPTPISLEYPAGTRTGGSQGRKSVAKVQQADSATLKAAGPGARIYVTVTGRLETRTHFEMVLRGDEKIVPYGYGHLNACPARLVYEEIRDTVVMPADKGK